MDNVNNLLKIAKECKKKTPFIVFDLTIIEDKFKKFNKIFEGYRIYYSLKANAEFEVLKLLNKLNANFDIASAEELNLLKELKIAPERIAFSAPIKVADDIVSAYNYGVKLYAADSVDEINKLSTLAPNSEIFIRLAVDNSGALWPLTRKFGVGTEDAAHLIAYAQDSRVKPVGLSFHVGSQNMNKQNWILALENCVVVSQLSKKRNIPINLINIGGGFPAKYDKEIPSLYETGNMIKNEINNRLPGVDVMLEPGRAIVAESGVMVASIIGKALRGNQWWYYSDVGLFNGLMEAYEKFKYPVLTNKDHYKKRQVTLAGPSCDSVDVIYEDILLPDLSVGDKIFFLSSGAYTSVYKKYNGFNFPNIVIYK